MADWLSQAHWLIHKLTEWLTITQSLTHCLTHSVNYLLTLNQSINSLFHSPTSTHSPTHIYSLSNTHPLTHWINHIHSLTHIPPCTHSLIHIHPLNHSTHSLYRMIDRSIWVPTIFNCKSLVWFISFHFISSRDIRILWYEVSRLLNNDFLLNKNRQDVAENRDKPVRILAASNGRKTMLLPQVLRAVFKRFISEIDRKYAENMWYPCPRLGRPNSFSERSLGMNFVAILKGLASFGFSESL